MNNTEFRKFLESTPEYRQFLVDFQEAEAKAIEAKKAITSQTSFTLSDGSVVSRAVLELIAYSSLGGRKGIKDTGPQGVAKSDAWDYLHALQEGYKLQGEKFGLTPDAMRTRNI
jgi:hypothetical protein